MIVARSIVKKAYRFKLVDAYQWDDGEMVRTSTWHIGGQVTRQEYQPTKIGEFDFCDFVGTLNKAFGLDELVVV